MMNAAQRLLTMRETAKYLRVSQRTLFTLRQRGELPFVKLSDRGIRFDLEDLNDFIAKGKHEGNHESENPPEDNSDQLDDSIDLDEENH